MPNTVEFYLSKGFDLKTAQYYAAGRRRIVSVQPCAPATLLLSFDNGERRLLDMSSYIRPGSVFAFLRDPAAFARVYLDDMHSVCWDIDPTVNSEAVWENRVDLCPDTCYLESVRCSTPAE